MSMILIVTPGTSIMTISINEIKTLTKHLNKINLILIKWLRIYEAVSENEFQPDQISKPTKPSRLKVNIRKKVQLWIYLNQLKI